MSRPAAQAAPAARRRQDRLPVVRSVRRSGTRAGGMRARLERDGNHFIGRSHFEINGFG